MDTLKIARFQYDIRHQLRWIEVYITVQVNDHELPHILDFAVFTKAIQAGGRHPLFTCGCGNFGCGGYYVDIEVVEQSWNMINRYSPVGENEILEAFKYQIPWIQVRDVYRYLLEKIRLLHNGEPALPIHWGVLGNAVDRMPSPAEIATTLSMLAQRTAQ